MKLNPYIMFAGNAEEALNFYKDCFNGEIKGLNRFGGSPMETTEEYKQKIMHASLAFGESVIMFSDGMPDEKFSTGGNVYLSVDVPEPEELEKVFNKIAEGGSVTMPLQDTFWGARFGMLKDKFGINWMFNCEKKK